MAKSEKYIYVLRKHLKNKKVRVFFYYSNQNPNPKERIEVKKSGHLSRDLKTLQKLIREQTFALSTPTLKREDEIIKDNYQKVTLNKLFVCQS